MVMPLSRARCSLFFLVLGGLALALAPGLVEGAHAAEGKSALVDQAGRKLREQDVSGAMRLLEQALQADPRDPDAHIMYQDTAREVLGLADVQTTYRRHAQENPDDPLFAYLEARLLEPKPAVAAFEKLKLRFKTSPWPQVGLARALERSGRLADALTALDKAIVLGGDDVRYRAYQAFALERGKRHSEAADSWARVLEKHPEDQTARIGLGEALRGAGDTDGAIKAFEEAAKRDPKDPEPVYRIGLAHLDADRFDEARAALDRALTLDRGMVEALCAASEAVLGKTVSKFDEGGAAIDEKALADAQAYADRAVASNPDSARAHFALGAVLEASGEANADLLESALDEYDAALDLLPFPGPDRMRVLSARSYVLLRLARWDEALTDARKCLDIDPTHVPAYAHGGHALGAMEKHEDSIKLWYEPGLKIAPENARLLHGCGTAWWNLNKQTKAVKLLKEAVKQEPKNGRYRLSLGEIYFELKKYKDAAKELFEATDLRPRDWVAWSAYGRACTAISDWESAAEAYEKVIEVDDQAVDEYLYLAILYADRLKNRKKAKENLEKFLDKDGWDDNLESWIDRLLEEEEE